jgi:mRNA interferase RelE/StbE
MEVKIDKTFQKDTRKIKDKVLLTKIAEVILSVQQAEKINQIKNLKKLKGSSGKFRIKIGDYRIGIIVLESSIEFIRCLHRKDIYKHFSK